MTGTCRPETVGLDPAVDVEAWPDAPFRWKDIATNLYSQAYRDSYTYDEAGVAITFAGTQDSAFTGHLSACDLKPNFAYQMKLVGKPEGVWGADGDDSTNELIGYAGRWWRVTPNPGNSSDQEYEAHRDDPEYIFEGYLLFDFFVTDRFGSAEVDFATRSSYHVLWWEGQRARGTCDSPLLVSTVVGQAGDPAYDGDVGPLDVGVYAEIERLCHGETVLTGGKYSCRFFLTEESFHQSGEDEGNWLSVLVCDTLRFDLRGPAGTEEVDPVRSRSRVQVFPNPSDASTSVAFSLDRTGSVDLDIYDTAGRLVVRLATGVFPAGDHSWCWDRTDCSGRKVPAGVYFCRLRRDREVRTGTIVLTR
jgi:hypothetical protein